MKALLSFCLFLGINSSFFGQTLIFAELSGSPTLNTTGWNLAGASYVGDTGGDADANSDELILTDNVNATSGAVFFNEPLDLATCYEWNVQFDFRMADGTNADGIAFCFLDVPPTGYVSGGGVGIPSTANGVKVIFDSYDNGCGMNPEIQIMNGIGYTECDPNVIRLNNTSGGELDFITDATYKTAVINYSFGTLSVTVNGNLYLTGNYNLDFTGYLGFTASTGGSNDRHSIKNVTVFADVAPSDAGPDMIVCNGESVDIGTITNPNFIYNWNSSPSLNAEDISNPTVNLINEGNVPISESFIVTTTLLSNPNSCATSDTVLVTILPNSSSTIDTSICAGSQLLIENQVFDTPGNYTLTLENIFGCDSSVYINLALNPAVETSFGATICSGESYAFNNLDLGQEGNYVAYLQTMEGCDSIVTLNLEVLPIENTTLNESICQGESFNFYGNVYSNTGLYTFTDQSSLGCDSIVNLNLNVLPIPENPIILTNSPVECPNDLVELSIDQTTNATCVWNGPLNFNSNDFSLTFPLNLENSGIYSVVVEVDGCISEASFQAIEIANIYGFDDFDFPNVITPNEDGVNDEIDLKEYFKTCQNFEFIIFNRWGNKVFYQNQDNEGFKGKDTKDRNLEDGTYFYKLSYNEGTIKSGFIQIIR